MNKQQIPPAAAGTQLSEQHRAEPRAELNPVAFEIEDDLFRAAALNDLAHWIGKAQNFIASVRLAVQHDERTKDALHQSGVALYSPEWRDDHATGLDVLHMTVDYHLGAIRRSAGLEAPRGVLAPATSTLEGSGNAH